MEKEDRIFQELIKEGMLRKAPGDLTKKVMQEIEVLEPATVNKQTIVENPAFILSSTLILASALSFGILRWVDKSFFSSFTGDLTEMLSGIYQSLKAPFIKWFSEYLSLVNVQYLFGVAVIMAMLLVLDNLLKRRKEYAGLLT